jgi:cystathionine beta-synthase
MSDEKIKALRSFGAKVVITPTNVEPDDPRSYYCVSRRIADETPGAFYANQYHNPSNPRAHYTSTGPEIWEQTGGKIDAFVCAAGTGGTLSGVAKYLKEQNPAVRAVGADPIGSVYYDYFRTGKLPPAHGYKVEGFGEDFLPSTMMFDYVDEFIRVTDKECFQMARRLVREEGLYTGGSAGGAVAAAVKYAERFDRHLDIVLILCDSASRYISKLFDDEWMRENGFLENDTSSATVADLLAARGGSGAVETATADDRVREVIGRMKRLGISQVPVLDGDKILGIVSERDLLNHLVHGGDAGDTIANLVEAEFAIVEPVNKVSLAGQLIAKDLTVLVVSDSRLIGVITKIDFIDFVSQNLK